MSDKKITVELTEDEARAFADIPLGDGYPDRVVVPIRDKVYAALPPEYPEGTIAWVTRANERTRWLAIFSYGQWHDGEGPNVGEALFDVTKVEPLRVLADDEIAVKRQFGVFKATPAEDLRRAAKWLRDTKGWETTSEFIDRIAVALDAEARP